MPIFYRFRDTTIYWSKICVFSPFLPTPILFEAITRRFPWDLGYERWRQKTGVLGWWKLYDHSFLFNTRCDRQTDRQTRLLCLCHALA